MPAPFRLSDLVETPNNRHPIAALRTQLAMAEADRCGLYARIAAGHIEAKDTVRRVNAKVYALRHSLDEMLLARFPFETINGSRLCTNDEDDMLDAGLHALERLEQGVDDSAAFRAPVHAADKAPAFSFLTGGL